MLRRGLLLGRVLASDDSGDEFPHRIGIHRRYIPSELKKERFKGAIVEATVARANTDKLRYDATCEFSLLTPSPDSKPKSSTTSGSIESGPEPSDELSDSIPEVTPDIEADTEGEPITDTTVELTNEADSVASDEPTVDEDEETSEQENSSPEVVTAPSESEN